MSGQMIELAGRREKRFRWTHLRFEYGHRTRFMWFSWDGEIGGTFTRWTWEDK